MASADTRLRDLAVEFKILRVDGNGNVNGFDEEGILSLRSLRGQLQTYLKEAETYRDEAWSRLEELQTIGKLLKVDEYAKDIVLKRVREVVSERDDLRRRSNLAKLDNSGETVQRLLAALNVTSEEQALERIPVLSAAELERDDLSKEVASFRTQVLATETAAAIGAQADNLFALLGCPSGDIEAAKDRLKELQQGQQEVLELRQAVDAAQDTLRRVLGEHEVLQTRTLTLEGVQRQLHEEMTRLQEMGDSLRTQLAGVEGERARLAQQVTILLAAQSQVREETAALQKTALDSEAQMRAELTAISREFSEAKESSQNLSSELEIRTKESDDNRSFAMRLLEAVGIPGDSVGPDSVSSACGRIAGWRSLADANEELVSLRDFSRQLATAVVGVQEVPLVEHLGLALRHRRKEAGWRKLAQTLCTRLGIEEGPPLRARLTIAMGRISRLQAAVKRQAGKEPNFQEADAAADALEAVIRTTT